MESVKEVLMIKKELKQFITSSNIDMIDKNVSGYILSDDYLNRCDLRPFIVDRFKILYDIQDPDKYFSQKNLRMGFLKNG